MKLENDKIAFDLNVRKAEITRIKNKLTGESYNIHEYWFEVETALFRFSSDDPIKELRSEKDGLTAIYSNSIFSVSVTYRLDPSWSFIEKQLTIRTEKDCGIYRVITGILEFPVKNMGAVEYRYPDFDIIEQKVEEEYHFGIKREPGLEPCRTFFGRTIKGGFMAGMESAFDSSCLNENKIIFSCSPNIKLKAGDSIDIEPVYIGVYKKSKRDMHSGCIADHKKTLPLSSESEAMVKLAECILGKRRKTELFPMVCGWHSEMEQKQYTEASVLADMKGLKAIRSCGINWLSQSSPWGGETQKMNELKNVKEYSPGPLVMKFLQRANDLGINISSWFTMNNTNPWGNGMPFRADRKDWLRDVGDHIHDWPLEFRGAVGNCIANKPFLDWIKELFKQAALKGHYKVWTMDGDFWGTGGFFQTTVPVECFSDKHDHLPGDANYASQRSLQELMDFMRNEFPDIWITMCRPAMDMGVWALKNSDVVFTLIETGTGISNIKGGDEIRTASRIRTSHHFIPHYMDWPLLFPSHSDPSCNIKWSSSDLDYIMLSALSCSPNMLLYLPLRTGIPAEDQREIKKWLDWGRDNIEYLMVRKDLPGWPGEGLIDGSCHILEDKGMIFLFNPGSERSFIDIELTEDNVDLKSDGNYILMQEYPKSDMVISSKYGQSVRWGVPALSAAVIRINKDTSSS